MAKNCLASFKDAEGFRHTVEVEAESLYDAVALAARSFADADCLSQACLLLLMAFVVVLVLRSPEWRDRESGVDRPVESGEAPSLALLSRRSCFQLVDRYCFGCIENRVVVP
jgi:hypothetical protein